jgi:hypothetical protein
MEISAPIFRNLKTSLKDRKPNVIALEFGMGISACGHLYVVSDSAYGVVMARSVPAQSLSRFVDYQRPVFIISARKMAEDYPTLNKAKGIVEIDYVKHIVEISEPSEYPLVDEICSFEDNTEQLVTEVEFCRMEALLRAAKDADLDLLSMWYDNSSGMMASHALYLGGNSEGVHRVFTLSDSPAPEPVEILLDSTNRSPRLDKSRYVACTMRIKSLEFVLTTLKRFKPHTVAIYVRHTPKMHERGQMYLQFVIPDVRGMVLCADPTKLARPAVS